ncbi:glycosyltransferase family 2 protein [Bacillus sp. T33-2]|uniref:glycosyltransferase family 2 protein n=1 Tax=Bacillus sp. T33-2 TaxID=2054168 RepID=UPI000C75802E|nr:glycosyltransferase family 2 protein [Bacillus sp. T33-2]PLR91230.1 hypothetical protein CVD19_21815 [Bacillus sp. T33-2]
MDIIDVTVIIPCFNSRDTIERTINSVLSQTCLPKQLIIIDDCSWDDSVDIIKKTFPASVHHEMECKLIALNRNHGVSHARNIGIENAAGSFIAFLDSDDTWHPQKLEIQFNFMNENKQVFLSSHETKKVSISEYQESIIERFSTKNFKDKKIGLIKSLFINEIYTRTVMVKNKKDIVHFNPGKKRSEDYLLWLQILTKGLQVKKLQTPLSYSFKGDFGDAGLTGDMKKMQIEEIDTLKRIFTISSSVFSKLLIIGAMFFSYMKYMRRIIKKLGIRS